MWGLQGPKSSQEVPGGDEVNCDTWFLLHFGYNEPLCLGGNNQREDNKLM